MPKVSPKARRLYVRVPVWANALGGVLLVTQLITGISLATASTRTPVAVPVQQRETPIPATPVPADVETTPEPTPEPTPSPSPTLEVDRIPEGTVVRLKKYSGTPSPVIGEVRDRKARLRYAELGEPWKPAKGQPEGLFSDGRYSTRQTFVTEEYGPDLDNEWFADIDAQRLWSDLDGGDSPYDAAVAMLDYKQENNFPRGTKGKDVASQRVPNGWLVAREMRMPPSELGRKARLELAVAVAVETGADRPSVIWITIPETHKRLWPDVSTVVSSLRVLR
ncbi:hypothetical protein GT755_27745 [Herbidospora sp. NEAU-GS84]|uniref:Uncharacterized protein n=1 Tax=Herbidospora solisilvae TaxID=2696284 RepID=A0A7C9JET1_9ACTN|nr:hypothetical protein [Herbidospora solisilvae]NAS25464.1 hypothetical protein [Herbidospora solisilvae]